MTAIRFLGMASRDRQHGHVLIVSLILLVVVTMLGLTGMQSTALQTRMSSNLYDRSLAMQATEAALRAAEFAITTNPEIGLLCTAESGNDCPPIPDDTFTGDSNAWSDADPPFTINNIIGAGNAQYHIEILGDWSDEDEIGLSNSANCAQYGGSCGPPTVRYYRVTARSHDPSEEGLGNRALVVLQTWVRRAI